MRIQLQNATFYPIVGGIENYFYYVSKALLTLGHMPVVLCFQHDRNLPLQDTCEGIKIIRHPYKVPFRSIPVYDLLHFKWLGKFIEKNCEDTDAVWSRHPYYCFASGKTNLDLPIIYIQATAFPLFHRYVLVKLSLVRKVYHTVRNWEDYHIERHAMEKCTKIIVLSKMRLREISEYYDFPRSKFQMIPPGVDLEVFKPRERDGNLLKELDIPENGKVILSVGRIRAEKNFLMLVDAFARFDKDDTYLVIVGDGIQKAELKEKGRELDIESRLRFPGYGKDIERFYSIADIFVLPSKYEGFGHVYLEAMASGIPCIGLKSDYPKIIVASEEIIKEGETGLLCNNSVADLTEKIDRIISDKELREKMSRASREICEKKYSWEKHVKSLLEITQQFLIRGNSR